MRVLWRPALWAGCGLLLAASAHAAPSQRFVDPIDQAAQTSPLAARAPVMALAGAGQRLVAAGVRGHILWSDNGGQAWTQASVPVSVDLTGLSFPSATQGWAVGHGGVVLHSADAGRNWTRQLGGLDAARLAKAYYDANPPKDAQLVSGLAAQLQDPRGEPFLDVHFWNDRSGFIVGTFGSIFRTDDGGKTWTPWMDRLDNPGGLNLFAVRGRGERVFVVGEQGKVWRLDTREQRFVTLSTPYPGTFFGVHVGEGGHVLAYGMRGSLFRSTDDGASWSAIKLETHAGLTAATETAHGVVVVDQAGNLLSSRDGGASFTRTPARPPAPIFAVAPAGPQQLVLGGPIGLVSQPQPQPQP